jgi:hypothetical protein
MFWFPFVSQNDEHHRVAGENVSIKTRVMATPVHAFVRQFCYRA